MDDPTIQSMCRWASTQSLDVYSRISKVQYSDLVQQAATARFDSVQAATLWNSCPRIDNDDQYMFCERLQEHISVEDNLRE